MSNKKHSRSLLCLCALLLALVLALGLSACSRAEHRGLAGGEHAAELSVSTLDSDSSEETTAGPDGSTAESEQEEDAAEGDGAPADEEQDAAGRQSASAANGGSGSESSPRARPQASASSSQGSAGSSSGGGAGQSNDRSTGQSANPNQGQGSNRSSGQNSSSGSSNQGGNSGTSGSGQAQSNNSSQSTAPRTITVSIEIEARLAHAQNPAALSGIANNGVILARRNVTLSEGATVRQALDATGVRLNARGAYIAGIGGLSEGDLGPRSGWMFSVNGQFSGSSASAHRLNAGDNIAWRYTINGGADLGASW